MDLLSEFAETFTIYSLCEYAVTLEFDDEIAAKTLDRIVRFNTQLNEHPFDGFRTTVPAYTTLSVFFDPIQVMQSSQLRGINCFQRVSDYLKELRYMPGKTAAYPSNAVTIPICYGGEFGPDLDEVAHRNGLTPAEVVQQHSTALYHVYLIGFTPGFPYLGGLPQQLATPRKPTPRPLVPHGSVGIAGKQTGIYPQDTPGGWQIIGRTPLPLFDATNRPPARLKAGDQVVFQPISPEQFYTNS
ncbi:5-oxoprolinase subunit PxpB [Parapedobacter indicus]|uniref:Inhibitor of KinA n=1 Tax=Parapedobacter indicus TaxID=1477437 RepID=A0A1I3QP34_9SPHI|nr:5-oxoprolinase subunit PxpB [Parapedobacter indicus]PPL00193.1 inhibitor of KinA [Parapedobacter indicus]SFJ35848.1 inhibitor of KinA [Parapedobacter indicus]